MRLESAKIGYFWLFINLLYYMEKIKKEINMREIALENLKKTNNPGRPLGSKNKKTLAKEKMWVEAEQKVLNDVLGLIQSQINVAHGVSVMMVPTYRKVKNKKGKWVSERTGKFRQETNVSRIVERLEYPDEIDGEDYYYIYAEKPNVKALEDVISRVFGRSRDKDTEPQDPFQLAFRNLFLNFTQNNTTQLVNAENNAPNPTKIYEQPEQLEQPKPTSTDGPEPTDIVERIERAVSKPGMAAQSPILD